MFMFFFLKNNRYGFLQENIVCNGYFLLIGRFYMHKKESDIADDSFNNKILFQNFYMITNFQRMVKKQDKSGGDIRQHRPLRNKRNSQNSHHRGDENCNLRLLNSPNS